MYKILTAIYLTLFCFQSHAQNTIKINSKIYSPKQLHQDVDYALEKFESIHPNFYKDTPKDTVVKRFALLKAKITEPITRFDFMNLLTPIALGVIHDGHNFTFPLDEEYNSYVKGGGKLFPVPVIIRNRKLYCNSTKTTIPLNSEITAINHVAASQVVEAVLAGYTMESDELEELTCSAWFNSMYWQTFGGFDAYQIDYFEPGKIIKKEILLAGLVDNDLEEIRIKPKADYEFEELPELKTAVFKLNSNEGDLHILRKFCDSIFTIIKQKQYTNLVIDIRKNWGGTTRANDVLFEYITDKPVSQIDSMQTKVSRERKNAFVRGNRTYAGWFKWYHYLYYPIYLRGNARRKKIMTARNGTFMTEKFPAMKPADNPLKFKGKLYLLTSINSYSAANGMAAAFKCYGLGPVIGQETGQPMVSTADWADFTLPNTKLRFASSISLFYWAGGKNDGHGVIPDHIIRRSNSDKDNEIDFVLEMIKNGK